MATNEFDSLIDNLAVVQRLEKPLACLRKRWAQGWRSANWKFAASRRSTGDATRPTWTCNLQNRQSLQGASHRGEPAATPDHEGRARVKVRAAVPELLHKALAMQAAGEMTAEQVSALEARLHRMMEAVQ